MKKILTLAAAAFIFTSCGNNKDHNANQDVATTDHIEDYMKEDGSSEQTGPLDPICKMVKTDDWELHSVHENDTTWFCSDFCKETFDKNPEKYANH